MMVNGICGSLKKHFRIQQKHHSNYVFEIIVALVPVSVVKTLSMLRSFEYHKLNSIHLHYIVM